jgi:hypothetical protein
VVNSFLSIANFLSSGLDFVIYIIMLRFCDVLI